MRVSGADCFCSVCGGGGDEGAFLCHLRFCEIENVHASLEGSPLFVWGLDIAEVDGDGVVASDVLPGADLDEVEVFVGIGDEGSFELKKLSGVVLYIALILFRGYRSASEAMHHVFLDPSSIGLRGEGGEAEKKERRW